MTTAIRYHAKVKPTDRLHEIGDPAAHAEAHDPQPVSLDGVMSLEKVDGGVDVGDHGGVAQPGPARGAVVAAVGPAAAVEIASGSDVARISTRSVVGIRGPGGGGALGARMVLAGPRAAARRSSRVGATVGTAQVQADSAAPSGGISALRDAAERNRVTAPPRGRSAGGKRPALPPTQINSSAGHCLRSTGWGCGAIRQGRPRPGDVRLDAATGPVISFCTSGDPHDGPDRPGPASGSPRVNLDSGGKRPC